jgi:integrase/recombinase XerC
MDDLNEFSNFCRVSFETDDLLQVTSSMIRSWVVELMEKGRDPRTVRRKLSCLNAFFRFQMSQGLLESNPVRKVPAPKVSKRLPVFVEESRMEDLFSGALFAEDFSGIRDRLLLEVLYGTGMRRAEIIGLQWKDISSDRMRVLGKRNKERIIPITPELAELMGQYKKHLNEISGNTEDWFLVDDKGKKMTPSFVYRKVNEYLTKVTSITKKSPHVLRHTFATHLLNKGADLNAIKEILGHASLAATQVYTHNTIEKLKNVYQKAHPLAG